MVGIARHSLTKVSLAEKRIMEEFPFRLSEDGRVATWNPGLTRAGHVVIQVRNMKGVMELRRSMNSGRARVRDDERIEAISPSEA